MSKLSPNPDNYMLGKGKLYIAKLDADGASLGEADCGNVTAVSVTATVDKLDHFSSQSGVKQKDKTVITQVASTFKFTGDEITIENLCLFLLGTSGRMTQIAGTVASETFTARHDKWVKLNYRNVSSVVITGKTVDTDFEVDAVRGRIKILSTGTIADSSSVTVAYSHGAIDYPNVAALKEYDQTVFVRFVGDPAQGSKYEAEIWKVKLKPSGDLNLISDDWANMQFEGEIQQDTVGHPDNPWFNIIDITENEADES